METKSPDKPRQGYRRTNVMLRHDQWDRLRSIQDETGVSPSFTLRKLIDGMAEIKRRPNKPTA